MSETALPPGLGILRRMSASATAELPIDWRFFLRRIIDRVVAPLLGPLLRLRIAAFALRVQAQRRAVAGLASEDIAFNLDVLRGRLSLNRPFSGAMARALALIAVLSERTVGLSPFASQIRGAAVLLSGGLAELETGAGKTLTAALAAIAAVHAGETVHLITANDYLAERDATELGPLYRASGVAVGLIVHKVPPESRGEAYACDLVYASNKEIAFDYLRDRITMGAEAGPIRLVLEPVHAARPRCRSLTMRGLPFAIVDEADSVLIDECRTPLIISADADRDPAWAHMALQLGDALADGQDYEVSAQERKVVLTADGKARLAQMGGELGGIWRNSLRREEAARQGLVARRFFLRDEHYLVRDDKVELVDEYTGRVAPDRALGEGLHQIIQAKEGVTVTGRRYTKGRITYQRFFRRYGRLAGMTGTAQEVAGELAAVYGLRVIWVRPQHRSRRRRWRTKIFGDEAAKWLRVARRAAKMVRQGRPVLIATRTIRASLAVSEALDAAGIEHVVLNAAQDEAEGKIIAEAGQAGRVTVATNMAGRGVDIKLGPGVAACGGLHVILTERHEAGRIDRQVAGRCGRQGEPGSVEAILSWEDLLVTVFGGWRGRWHYGGVHVFARAQERAERLHARARLDLLRHDQRRDEKLTFTGSVE